MKVMERQVLTAFAPLPVVPTTNFLRYGGEGVRPFGRGKSERPWVLRAIARLKAALGAGEVALPTFDLALHPPDALPNLAGVNHWVGVGAGFQLEWVWDFYRLYSGVKLHLKGTPDAEHRAAWEGLKAGDHLLMSADLPTGAIFQVYPIHKGSF